MYDYSTAASMNFVIIVFWLLVGPLVGYAIGNTRGRAGLGVFLGLFLGPIGWLITFVLEPADTHKCPHCGKAMSPGYKICGACGRERDIAYYTCHLCKGTIRYRQSPCPNCGEAIDWSGIKNPADSNIPPNL